MDILCGLSWAILVAPALQRYRSIQADLWNTGPSLPLKPAHHAGVRRVAGVGKLPAKMARAHPLGRVV